jgi:hypothetical protein
MHPWLPRTLSSVTNSPYFSGSGPGRYSDRLTDCSGSGCAGTGVGGVPHWCCYRVDIQPATVLKWHREGYRRYWRRRSGGIGGRPRIPRSHINLIRRISSDHPEWGEDRIALELKAKLGVKHAPSTIRRYMMTRKEDGGPVSSTWRTFLAGHAAELWTMDLTTQSLWNYSVRYVLVFMELRSRRVVQVAVTARPTLAWVKQRIREATPFGSVPRFLVHDNDGIFGQFGRGRVGRSGRRYRSALDLWLGEVLRIKGIPIPYGAPEGVPEPLHLPVGRSSSPRCPGIHLLLQRRSTSSGNRGPSGVRPRLAEGDPSYDRGLPDQGRCPSRAWWASPRLPNRRVDRTVLVSCRRPMRPRSYLVMPTIPDSGIDRARRVPFG